MNVKNAIVQGENYRFTVLTPSMIRMEYSEKGVFVDKKTQMVVNRTFDVPEYTVKEKNGELIIETDKARLVYTGGKFAGNNLRIEQRKYLIAGSLLFKDMKMMSELASGAVSRSVLYAKGATEGQAMGYLQPIVIDTHPIQNPWLNYSVYLCNTLVPGVLMLMIFMVTVFSIGVEIKDRTAREWLRLSNNSIYIALAGKLLPQTVVFFIMGIFYNVYLYGFLHFPCNSGILPMLLATLCLVLASQCCGIVMIGTLPTLRLGLSFASLWGVISFSISGFSFPVMAMNPVLQALSNLFPLRHYFLIYVDQALNGYSMAYSWSNYMALLIFMLLPFFVVHRLKEALIYYKYMP